MTVPESRDLPVTSRDNSCKSFDAVVAARGLRLDRKDDHPLAWEIEFVILAERPVKTLSHETLATITFNASTGQLRIELDTARPGRDSTLSIQSQVGCENGAVVVGRTTVGGNGESVLSRVDSIAVLKVTEKGVQVSLARRVGVASKFEQSNDIRRSEYLFPLRGK